MTKVVSHDSYLFPNSPHSSPIHINSNTGEKRSCCSWRIGCIIGLLLSVVVTVTGITLYYLLFLSPSSSPSSPPPEPVLLCSNSGPLQLGVSGLLTLQTGVATMGPNSALNEEGIYPVPVITWTIPSFSSPGGVLLLTSETLTVEMQLYQSVNITVVAQWSSIMGLQLLSSSSLISSSSAAAATPTPNTPSHPTPIIPLSNSSFTLYYLLDPNRWWESRIKVDDEDEFDNYVQSHRNYHLRPILLVWNSPVDCNLDSHKELAADQHHHSPLKDGAPPQYLSSLFIAGGGGGGGAAAATAGMASPTKSSASSRSSAQQADFSDAVRQPTTMNRRKKKKGGCNNQGPLDLTRYGIEPNPGPGSGRARRTQKWRNALTPEQRESIKEKDKIYHQQRREEKAAKRKQTYDALSAEEKKRRELHAKAQSKYLERKKQQQHPVAECPSPMQNDNQHASVTLDQQASVMQNEEKKDNLAASLPHINNGPVQQMVQHAMLASPLPPLPTPAATAAAPSSSVPFTSVAAATAQSSASKLRRVIMADRKRKASENAQQPLGNHIIQLRKATAAIKVTQQSRNTMNENKNDDAEYEERDKSDDNQDEDKANVLLHPAFTQQTSAPIKVETRDAMYDRKYRAANKPAKDEALATEMQRRNNACERCGAPFTHFGGVPGSFQWAHRAGSDRASSGGARLAVSQIMGQSYKVHRLIEEFQHVWLMCYRCHCIVPNWNGQQA
jgi:hypothetical protein